MGCPLALRGPRGLVGFLGLGLITVLGLRFKFMYICFASVEDFLAAGFWRFELRIEGASMSSGVQSVFKFGV